MEVIIAIVIVVVILIIWSRKNVKETMCQTQFTYKKGCYTMRVYADYSVDIYKKGNLVEHSILDSNEITAVRHLKERAITGPSTNLNTNYFEAYGRKSTGTEIDQKYLDLLSGRFIG